MSVHKSFVLEKMYKRRPQGLPGFAPYQGRGRRMERRKIWHDGEEAKISIRQ